MPRPAYQEPDIRVARNKGRKTQHTRNMIADLYLVRKPEAKQPRTKEKVMIIKEDKAWLAAAETECDNRDK